MPLGVFGDSSQESAEAILTRFFKLMRVNSETRLDTKLASD